VKSQKDNGTWAGGQASSAKHDSIKPLSWIILATLILMLLWSARALFDYGELCSKLWGKSFLERGYVGSDEWQDFLARAGRPITQKAFAEAELEGVLDQQRSGVAAGWAFVVKAEEGLPKDAKIFLNVPSMLLYYYGTAVWYPRQVDVATQPVLINGGATLVEIFNKDPSRLDERQLVSLERQLRRLGYTHLVTVKNGVATLIDLRSERGASPP
jgi:hypothetical protein